MRRLRFSFAALVAMLLASFVANPADAIALSAARSQGLVGETRSGFLAPVKSPSSDVQQLIQSVNAKRRNHYRKIAGGNGVGIEEVGRLSADKTINGLPRGAYFQGSDGSWRQK
jgi:uncharacterized protein YdbL (DUF1318 family)